MLRDAERLSHIVESTALLGRYVHGVDFRRFESDQMLQDAVLRRLILIGEASGKLSQATTARFPQVPWRIMADFRNLVVHEYHRIDWQIVWTVVAERLPSLHGDLERIAAALDAEDQSD